MPTPRALVQAVALPNKEATSGIVSAPLLAALTSWIAPTQPDFVNPEYEWEDDSDEINGSVLATTHTLVQKSNSLARQYNLSTELAAWLLALQLGNVTSSAASSAVNEVQRVVITGTLTAGGFILTFRGATTPELAYNVSAAAMQAALEALPTIGAGNVTVVLAAGTYTVTFVSALAARNVPQITVQVTTALVGGTIATNTLTEGSAAGVYTHTIRWPDPCILNPATTALAELLKCAGSTATYKLYKFLAVNGLSFDLNGKGKIGLTADFKGDGTETAIPSFVGPASPLAVTRLYGSMASVYFGAGFTLLPTNTLRTLKIGQSSDLQIPPTISANTFIEELQLGEAKPDLTIELSVKGDKSDQFWVALAAGEFGSRYKFRITLQPHSASQRKLELTCNQVLVRNVEQVPEGNETRLNVTLTAEANTTDGAGGGAVSPGVWTAETAIPAYLVAL